MPDSPWDLAPVVGSGRRALYNMSCGAKGGCNISRATGYAIQTAVDAATLVEGLWKVGGKLFVEEVTEETTEVGANVFLREPQSLMDQMVLDAAKNGAGKEVIENLGDDAFKGMTKMSYSETSANGVLSEVHYVKNPKTEELMDFKFKPSTMQKTNSLIRYANATKNGTIVAPK